MGLALQLAIKVSCRFDAGSVIEEHGRDVRAVEQVLHIIGRLR